VNQEFQSSCLSSSQLTTHERPASVEFAERLNRRERDVLSEVCAAPTRNGTSRVVVDGKGFRCGGRKWYARGLTYGPFRPQGRWHLPEPSQVLRDLRQMRRLGANALRIYHQPPVWFLDQALRHGLRVLIDVPWEKHRCFLEDWGAQRRARARVRHVARQLGQHPAVLAISVANEIPTDIVRFQGAKRIASFLDQLLEVAKEQHPECLVTYVNYPSTEFLAPRRSDFYCANVYLNDAEVLARYLDRLQHVAGNRPLVLGEFGLDSLRNGEIQQAQVLGRHVEAVFQRGLAGSFVFSFTDDWFTGGADVEDWAFGITKRSRGIKPAAETLRRAWASIPCINRSVLPSVSVVVASYNGGASLRECLESLRRLNYPRYEVILVDDGSIDHTPQIARDFREVRCIRQSNLGLSAARNAGLAAATGDIVAYTDSDCVVDETWLLYLMQAMRDQGVDAIGGPNVTPPSDSWTAKCVACSPGNPSHVMLDDQQAEHIPGCNMAFRRDVLLGLGGFDVQFRQAGDDVDICWRLLDAGHRIGYAPAALVWHHRRQTVRAYCRQQQGYGRSEAMLQFKHPQRFNALCCSRWNGIIYGDGTAGIPAAQPLTYYGRFGAALFQRVYQSGRFSARVYFTILEWHALAAFVLILSASFWPLALLSAAMWLATLASVVHAACVAELPSRAPPWCRGLIACLHVIQPVVRACSRYRWRFAGKRLPLNEPVEMKAIGRAKRVRGDRCDFFWTSSTGRGREALLEQFETVAKSAGWRGNYDNPWKARDIELMGDFWHNLRLCTATEVFGQGRRFTRLRCELVLTVTARLIVAAIGLSVALAAIATQLPFALANCAVALLIGAAIARSRKMCFRWIGPLIWRAGQHAGLTPVTEIAARIGTSAVVTQSNG
jgi:GT2 family glycosyltransferase